MFIYKIEVPGRTLMQEFATLQEAKDFALAVLSWSGTRYRIHRIRRAA